LSGKTTLKKNDVILVDFGAKINNYCADVSRTFFIGTATKKQKEIYELVYETQQKTITHIQKLLRSGKPILSNEVDAFARANIQDKGYPPFPYSLGHGIGLQVHESPLLNPKHKDKMTNGMVFALEPGIHLTGEIGVRIEDNFFIKGKQLIQLTHSTRDLIAL
jgi:Xaa-Pro aminopeptidase